MFPRYFSTAAYIKLLRDRTGAPISKCRKAILLCGSIEPAIEWIRQDGVSQGVRRSAVGSEGLIAVAVGDRRAAVFELCCETDFAAKSEVMLSVASGLAVASFVNPEMSLWEQLHFLDKVHPLVNSLRASDALKETSALLGEAVSVRGTYNLRGRILGVYMHQRLAESVNEKCRLILGKQLGLVSLESGEQATSCSDEFAHMIARQVVAASPRFCRADGAGEGDVLEDSVLLGADENMTVADAFKTEAPGWRIVSMLRL